MSVTPNSVTLHSYATCGYAGYATVTPRLRQIRLRHVWLRHWLRQIRLRHIVTLHTKLRHSLRNSIAPLPASLLTSLPRHSPRHSTASLHLVTPSSLRRGWFSRKLHETCLCESARPVETGGQPDFLRIGRLCDSERTSMASRSKKCVAGPSSRSKTKKSCIQLLKFNKEIYVRMQLCVVAYKITKRTAV